MSRRSVARPPRSFDLAMTSQADSAFKECMTITRLLMRSIGVWPLDDVGIWSTCRFLMLMLPLFFLNILPQTAKAKAIESRNDFTTMLNVITVVDINEFLVFVQTITLWRRRLEMETLVTQMHEDWWSSSADERARMRFHALASKWLLRIFTGTAFGTVLAYDVLYLDTFEAKTIRANGTIYRPLYLLSYFPFEARASPVYEIIAVGQVLAVALSALSYIAYESVYAFSVLHCSGHLCNLKRRMRDLVREHRRAKVPFVRCIESVVRRHSHLLSHANIIEDNFNLIFLLQVFALSVVLCLQGYELIKLTSETDINISQVIHTSFLTLLNLNCIFLSCAIAQVIRDESLSLFDEIYQMQWYELPAKDALLVVIVIGRCTRPIELTVGKFTPLTLEYFARVLKAIAGYISVLLAIKDKIME